MKFKGDSMRSPVPVSRFSNESLKTTRKSMGRMMMIMMMIAIIKEENQKKRNRNRISFGSKQG